MTFMTNITCILCIKISETVYLCLKPMAIDQVVSERDSEDEVDDDVADFEDRRVCYLFILLLQFNACLEGHIVLDIGQLKGYVGINKHHFKGSPQTNVQKSQKYCNHFDISRFVSKENISDSITCNVDKLGIEISEPTFTNHYKIDFMML